MLLMLGCGILAAAVLLVGSIVTRGHNPDTSNATWVVYLCTTCV